MIWKVLTTLNARETHLLMCKPVKEGGFEGAYEKEKTNADGSPKVRFSIKTIRTIWPNHLKVMTDADKVVCGCSTCCDTDDVTDAYNGKRRKIVAAAEVKLEEMEDSTESEIDAKAGEQEAQERKRMGRCQAIWMPTEDSYMCKALPRDLLI